MGADRPVVRVAEHFRELFERRWKKASDQSLVSGGDKFETTRLRSVCPVIFFSNPHSLSTACLHIPRSLLTCSVLVRSENPFTVSRVRFSQVEQTAGFANSRLVRRESNPFARRFGYARALSFFKPCAVRSMRNSSSLASPSLVPVVFLVEQSISLRTVCGIVNLGFICFFFS